MDTDDRLAQAFEDATNTRTESPLGRPSRRSRKPSRGSLTVRTDAALPFGHELRHGIRGGETIVAFATSDGVSGYNMARRHVLLPHQTYVETLNGILSGIPRGPGGLRDPARRAGQGLGRRGGSR